MGTAAVLAVVLGACGGGSASSSSPTNPASTESSTSSQVDNTATAGSPDTAVTPSVLEPVPTTVLDATRLAQQATFGPTESLTRDMAEQGAAAWVQAQLSLSGSSYQSGGGPEIHQWAVRGAMYCDTKSTTCWRDNFTGEPLLWDFYRNALTQPDQLRQRMALALQQILVVSSLSVESTYGLRQYHNMLLNQAFGNYREILKKVILSPVMGDYLNNVNNDKSAPNENFARELLQLFTVGPCLLAPDGSYPTGSCQATYDNAVVRDYAYALTGWTYPAGGQQAGGCWPTGANCTFHGGDMVPVTKFHDTAARQLLAGVTLAEGHTPAQAVDAVLDSVMNHPNMAPFIGRQLIAHLVSSNPSPAYVQRVAQAFTQGKFQGIGTGVRGDLAATVAAVLLDNEARDLSARSSDSGKLRSPVLFMTGVLRALNGHTDGAVLSWWWGNALGQFMFKPPSVFSYYPPDYPLTGHAPALAPEFALHNTSTVLERLNFLQYLLMWGGTAASVNPIPNAVGTGVDVSAWVSDADDPARLVDRLSVLAWGEPLPSAARQTVIAATQAITAENAPQDWRLHRVRQAAYLVMGSPYFQIQR